MTNGKDAKTDLVTGLICAFVGAVIAGLLSYWLVRWQMNKERIDRAQEKKLELLSEQLEKVAVARTAASGHNDGEAEVNTFISESKTFCDNYQGLEAGSDWDSYPALDRRFQTQFEGVYYMICHVHDFYTSTSTKGIPANAYQFVEPKFIHDVSKQVDAAALLN